MGVVDKNLRPPGDYNSIYSQSRLSSLYVIWFLF